jgi:sugar phosphate isomerase/epimerase
MNKTKLIAAFLGTSLAVFASEKEPPVGLQLVSLHEALGSNLDQGLGLVKSLGFTLVETAGDYGMTGDQLRARLDAHGLKAVSTHFQYPQLEANLAGVIATAKSLGSTHIIVPWIPHTGVFDEAKARKAAADFNAWGKVIKAAGLRLGYHPHGGEFEPLAGGGTGFDILARETDPNLLFFEMDVFWVVHAGQDPVALMEKFPGRWKMFHLKDMRKGAATGIFTGQAPITDFVPLGTGRVDWPAVIAEGRKEGVEYSFIEDEGVDPPKEIPISLRYLSSIGR